MAEYTRHHVRQEENRIFERTARARVDWEALLQDMQQRRAELIEEIGVATIEFDTGLAPDERITAPCWRYRRSTTERSTANDRASCWELLP
jgi:hypothetical protein